MMAEPDKTGSFSEAGESQFVTGDQRQTCQGDRQSVPVK
jgi:hypothetical protein